MDDVEIETYVDGGGPAFVLPSSYGRGSAENYDDITARLMKEGWKVLRPQPRGIAGSKGPMNGVILHDLANDVALSVRSYCDVSAVVLGHAFGNLLARMVTTDHPDLVKAVVLGAAQATEVAEDIERMPFIAGVNSGNRLILQSCKLVCDTPTDPNDSWRSYHDLSLRSEKNSHGARRIR